MDMRAFLLNSENYIKQPFAQMQHCYEHMHFWVILEDT